MDYNTEYSFETKEIKSKIYIIKVPNTWEPITFKNIYEARSLIKNILNVKNYNIGTNKKWLMRMLNGLQLNILIMIIIC